MFLALLPACKTSSRSKFDPRAESAKFTAAGLQSRVDPALLNAPQAPYRLGPGDKLDIEILGETGSRAETFVTPDSKIYFNLLPGISVGGLTLVEAQNRLEAALKRYYRVPQVSVSLVDARSQRVWVLGRVNQPGIYPLTRPMQVLDAISLAGGLFTSRFTGTTEELADLEHSFFIRKGRIIPVNFQALLRDGDLSQNIYLQPDDYIFLPSSLSNEVYVLGAVMEPRPVGFMNEMNLMAALGRGLGLRPDADLTRVSIVRGSLTNPQVAVVNAREIMKGAATNIRLEPGDIVFVPGEGQLSPSYFAREALNTFVRIVAANEGGNAVSSESPNVGVNVDIGASAKP
ncbi:polysaccharide biosynthesis/export family protein [Verrucomicrobium spinosum]|uniref:polysaccharide biosynthesis/export family protein n=2 Tax=Verrucomicrobium spinosum TaxID=2736 RepID=UPI000174512B|nr:polysaccharide biosynthesis/export family protein [Verrucomicrobium spinosum]